MNNKAQFFKHSLVTMAIVGALSTTASAQEETTSAKQDEIERIFVTASKREVGLQESPVAVTVISGKAIEQTKVLDIQDLQTLVPTLRVTPLQRSTNTNFSIRGFGNGTNNTGIEPSVGVFIDGVYRSRAAAQIGDLPRVSQIEVLSGPQSTLFGKNASAGVISVRTLAPSYDMEGKVEVGVGNYNQRQLKGYITNGVTDNLALSLSGGFNKRDGYTESVSDLSNLNDRDRWNIRGQALFEPSNDVTMRLIVDHSEIEEKCCTVDDPINGAAITAATHLLGGMVNSQDETFSYKSALTSDPSDKIEDGGISLQVDVELDGFDFTSITAVRKNEASFDNDVDYTSLDIISENAATEIDTFTQEFRLTSTGERTLDWMVGAYIFQEEVTYKDSLEYGVHTRPFFDVLFGGPALLAGAEGAYGLAPGSFFNADSYVKSNFAQDNDAYSIFANFDYHISDNLTAIFGISYTKDEKQVTITQDHTEALSQIDIMNQPTVVGIPLPGLGVLAGHPDPQVAALAGLASPQAVGGLLSVQFLPPLLQLPNSVESDKTEDSKTTWSTRLAYKVNDNVNVFASASTGFKASSWNLSRDTNPFASSQDAINSAGIAMTNQRYGGRYASPEESKVYELGVKTRFDNGAFNVTIFDQTIKGFQSSIFVGTGFILANAGKQSTKGIEFDSKYDITDDITVTFAGTLLDPVYDSFEGATAYNNETMTSGLTDLSGQKPAGIHEKSITAGIAYNFELSNGAIGYVRTDYLYESNVQIVENVPSSLNRQVNTWNASAGLEFDNGLAVQLWARNLNNDEYYMSAFPKPIQSGSFNAYPNAPRTFGLTVSKEF